MSNIPQARQILKNAQNAKNKLTKTSILFLIRCALLLMDREKPAKLVAKRNRETITPSIRNKVFAMAAARKSNVQIQVACGFHNPGRVTEILQGKR